MYVYIFPVYTYVAIAVLKKHYYDLLRSLPSDHMTSLGRLCQVATITDTSVDRVISCGSSRESNRAILDTLIYITDSDEKLIKFCNMLEEIVGCASDAIESLRSGMCMMFLSFYIAILYYIVLYFVWEHQSQKQCLFSI